MFKEKVAHCELLCTRNVGPPVAMNLLFDQAFMPRVGNILTLGKKHPYVGTPGSWCLQEPDGVREGEMHYVLEDKSTNGILETPTGKEGTTVSDVAEGEAPACASGLLMEPVTEDRSETFEQIKHGGVLVHPDR